MSDESQLLIGPLPGFDETYYLSNYPDVAEHPGSALDHYLTVGWKEGFKPSKGFDGDAYLKTNADVMAAGLCPLLHYLNYGLAEGRRMSPKSDR